MFCNFKTTYAGMCGRYSKDSLRCEKHEGRIEKPKTEKAQKFRGDSNWQKENMMFKNKGE